MEFIQEALGLDSPEAVKLLAVVSFSALVFGAWLIYGILYLVAPFPRPPLPLEKKYRTLEPDGNVSVYEDLPCWQDKHDWRKKVRQKTGKHPKIEEAEVYMSLVIPAFNEEERIGLMLREAVAFLDEEYGTVQSGHKQANGTVKRRKAGAEGEMNGHPSHQDPQKKGWEVLVISDGSTDKTVGTALSFAKSLKPEAAGRIRVISLHQNRGKGGAVTHGMRHVRGQYALFADADGASKFEDLGKLVRECKNAEDDEGRAVAVGSRAHLVGSEAVVKRSFLRNLLMHSFHLLLRLMTPKRTAAIKDTQCGFKLLSRASLPHIIPYMHSEGWIFDVEMLMLAESAGIPVVEVPVGWKEVKGSKLNVLWDSLGMAWGLFVLRAAWGMGIYSQS